MHNYPDTLEVDVNACLLLDTCQNYRPKLLSAGQQGKANSQPLIQAYAHAHLHIHRNINKQTNR